MALFREYNKKYDVDLHIWKDKISTTHGHDYYEFAICNKGEIIHCLNDNSPQRLKKGQAFFITPNDVHSIKSLKGATHINIAFTPNVFFELCRYFEISDLQKCLTDDVITLNTEELNRVEQKVNEILSMTDGKNEVVYIALLKALLVELFVAFLSSQNCGQKEEKPEWLREFVDKISSPEYFELPMGELYVYSNYSQPIVTREFKKYYGVTLSQYLLDRKMFYAYGLLKNTNWGLLEICNRVGISSLSHFNTLFKKYYGKTPGGIRKEGKGKETS